MPLPVSQAVNGRHLGPRQSERQIAVRCAAKFGQSAGGATVRLRGTSTVLGDADPLYVVDGVVAQQFARTHPPRRRRAKRLGDLNPKT